MGIKLLNYIIAHGLIGIIPISIGMFVLSRNPNNILYRRFFIYNAVISVWGAFTVLMHIDKLDKNRRI